MYSDVSTQKVVIEVAKHFAEYGNKVAKINVIYLDKSEVVSPNVEDSIPINGTLKILILFYYNSGYKKVN